MTQMLNRRRFLCNSAGAFAAGLAAGNGLWQKVQAADRKDPPFKISLAEWSFHKALFAKKMDHLDFPKAAKRDYDIHAIELVNQFFMDKATDPKYLAEFKKRADGEGVQILLIMVDDEGDLGDVDEKKRVKAVENHHKWVEAGKFFGCHSVRVNAETGGVGSFEDQQKRAADGLRKLSEFGAKLGLNIIVENHGGLSSNGKWLAGVMKMVNLPHCGTLPDFGNFTDYDRYIAVKELMPFAKAVSAKTNDFDAKGEEIHTDYRKMMKIVLDAGYHGFVGIEYEGEKMSESDGVRASKKLLETIRAEITRA